MSKIKDLVLDYLEEHISVKAIVITLVSVGIIIGLVLGSIIL